MGTALGLLVDDDHDIRRVFAEGFRRGGISVLEAQSGIEALALAQTSAFDFVVTDLDMPNMGGLELCRRLRSLSSAARVPIVVVTGASSQADEAIAAGCDVVLPKPCSPALLLATIQSLLNQA